MRDVVGDVADVDAEADHRLGRLEPLARIGAGATAGVAAGHTQVNLISVPADWAYDMLLFAQRNPTPCPVPWS